MDLGVIKKLSENRIGGLKKLAVDAGMSEQNLHRCIRLNKIQADDLEKISCLLNVDITVFFGGQNNKEEEIKSLKEEIQRLKDVNSSDKNNELYELCRELIENYKQRDSILDKLVSMTK